MHIVYSVLISCSASSKTTVHTDSTLGYFKSRDLSPSIQLNATILYGVLWAVHTIEMPSSLYRMICCKSEEILYEVPNSRRLLRTPVPKLYGMEGTSVAQLVEVEDATSFVLIAYHLKYYVTTCTEVCGVISLYLYFLLELEDMVQKLENCHQILSKIT